MDTDGFKPADRRIRNPIRAIRLIRGFELFHSISDSLDSPGLNKTAATRARRMAAAGLTLGQRDGIEFGSVVAVAAIFAAVVTAAAGAEVGAAVVAALGAAGSGGFTAAPAGLSREGGGGECGEGEKGQNGFHDV